MSYVLSEDEYSELHGLVCRIGVLTTLLEKSDEVTLSAEGLFCTLDGLRTPIEAALKAMDARHKAAGNGVMNPQHWRRMAQMLSGRGLYPYRDLVEMDERLACAVAADPAMGCVFDVWRAAMTDDGAFEMCTKDSTTLDFYAGLVRPLAIEKIEPIDACNVARMYNVENPDEVAQALADAANRGAVAPRKGVRKRAKGRAAA